MTFAASQESATPRRIACFGEMLLRLAAPRGEVLRAAGALDVFVGGAEANVAVALAHLGHASAMITVLADNPLGALCGAELRRHGVDCAAVRTGAGRMGLYFLERGAGQRPARVVYDREHSAFCRAMGAPLPWETLLAGSAWLHVSGITAALGDAGAQSLLAAVRAAQARQMSISFDCNYRPSLWQERAMHAGALLRAVAAHATVLFASEHDLALILQRAAPEASVPESFAAAGRQALERFGTLRLIATTFRQESGADEQTFSAACLTRDGLSRSRTYALRGIVERIGSGDAFAAGVLHGLLGGADPARAVELGAACACLKHTVATDFSVATGEELEALLRGQTALVR